MSANRSPRYDSTSTLSLAGAMRRLPKAVVKPVVLLMTAAIGLGGLTLAQSWMSAAPAGAVTFQNGWDGVFKKSDLWIKGSLGSNTYRSWTYPDDLDPVYRDPTDRFLGTGTTNGTVGNTSSGDTLAVGPIFKHLGDELLHMVDVDENNSRHTVFISDPDAGRVNGTAYSAFPSCAGVSTSGSMWSGEINQKNGYLYVVRGGPSPSMNGSSSSLTNAQPVIIRLNRSGSECVAAANAFTPPSAGQTINAQWNALTGDNYSRNWEAGSDMAIDANGNLYLFLTRGSDGEDNHALLRINVPHVNGEPQSVSSTTPWTFEVVRAFTASTGASAINTAVWGMAFLEGSLYTQHSNGNIWRWDTMSGAATFLADTSHEIDLASAQAAPVVQGTVYNDVNGDGSIVGDPVAPNVPVEVWQRSGATWTLRASLTTNTEGSYSSLMNSASGEYAVRIKRPTVNNVNATQTYAAAQSFYADGSSGAANILTSYCASGGADYQEQFVSGKCLGARTDGVDAISAATVNTTTANLFAATGGAAIVSRVQMNTDMAVVQADFGITAAASWGDAPLTQTTNAQSGPYANPYRAGEPYLYLGQTASIYDDGVNHAAAAAHSTDDGAEFAPIPTSGTVAAGDWESVQGKTMVVGKRYRFRIKVSGDAQAVAASTVGAWITSVSSSGAATTFNTPLTCTKPDDGSGYSYCDYQVGTTLPSSNTATVYLRVRVSNDAGVTATSRGPANPATSSWMPSGEVEDYQLGVATSALRVYVRTTGGVGANVRLNFSNVSTTPPSFGATTILTSGQGSWAGSPLAHSVTSRTTPVVITTAGVGQASGTAPTVDGWMLGTRETADGKDTYCYNAETGDPVPVTIGAENRMLSVVGTATAPIAELVTCYLTYIPEFDEVNSTVTAAPSNNEADRLVRPDGVSDVTLDVRGNVRNADGDLVPVSAEGQQVALTLTPRAGTGATAAGAAFEYNTGSG
ncbi:MAG: hypothetical protein LBD97_07875, partial [Bifidobacteriaceae bacterium]|nr:hypothetical protein [Bifidobacteriaceae bacterium]